MSSDIELEDLSLDRPEEYPSSEIMSRKSLKTEVSHDDADMYSAIFTAINADEVREKKSNIPPSAHSDVPLWKHIFATIGDVLITLSLLLLLKLELITDVGGAVEHSVFAFIMLTYYFIDYWYLPRVTGFTISRWVLGYEVVRGDLRKARVFDILKYHIVHILLGFGSLGIVPALSILIRKDSRSPHELAGGMVSRQKRSRFQVIRLITPLLITIYFLFASIEAGAEYLYKEVAIPHKILMYHDTNHGGGYAVETLPIAGENIEYEDSVNIVNSLYFIGVDSSNVAITESTVVISEDTFSYRITREQLDPAELLRDNIKWIVPHSWNVEELFSLYYFPLRQEVESSSKLLNPMANLKHLYSGLYCANPGGDYIMNTYCSQESGIIVTENGKGLYRWSRAIDNSDIVIFDLYEGNHRRRIKFRGTTVMSGVSTQYLINNIFYKSN